MLKMLFFLIENFAMKEGFNFCYINILRTFHNPIDALQKEFILEKDRVTWRRMLGEV